MNKTKARTRLATMIAFTMIALAGTASGILAIPAFAQSDVRTPLQQCAELTDDAERLACFDRLTAIAAESDAAEDGEPGAAPVSSTVATEAVEPVEAAASTTPADAEAPRIPVSESSSPEESQAVESATDDDDAEVITVVSLHRNLSGFAVFETAEGERWIQTDLTNRRYPPTPFTARVERAFLHGYFLRIEDGRIRIRASRVQ